LPVWTESQARQGAAPQRRLNFHWSKAAPGPELPDEAPEQVAPDGPARGPEPLCALRAV
jgi:hypothetical protein